MQRVEQQVDDDVQGEAGDPKFAHALVSRREGGISPRPIGQTLLARRLLLAGWAGLVGAAGSAGGSAGLASRRVRSAANSADRTLARKSRMMPIGSCMPAHVRQRMAITRGAAPTARIRRMAPDTASSSAPRMLGLVS